MKNTELDYIHSWLDFQFIRSNLPGMSVCIMKGEETLYEKPFGFAHLRNKECLTSTHIFRVGSLSKTLTVIGIMQLVEQGCLNLDHEAGKYLPFPIPYTTIRQLLSHTSGFSRDGVCAGFFVNEGDFPDITMIEHLFQNGGDIIENTTRYKYSNIGYALLGNIIEKIASCAYEDYVKNNILCKTNSHQIAPDFNASLTPYATGYSSPLLTNEKFELPFDTKTNALSSAGGLCASPAALGNLYKHLYFGNETLLSDASKKEMFRCQWQPNEGKTSNYGLGFLLEKVGNRSYVGHTGGFPGFVSKVLIDPRHQYVICVLTNTSEGTAIPIANSLCSLLQLFQDREMPSNTDNCLSKFSGRFYCLWGTYDFIPFGNKLYVSQPGNGPNFQTSFQLSPLGEYSFRVTEDNGTGHFGEPVTFHFDNDGKIEKVSFVGLNLYPKDIFLHKMSYHPQLTQINES